MWKCADMKCSGSITSLCTNVFIADCKDQLALLSQSHLTHVFPNKTLILYMSPISWANSPHAVGGILSSHKDFMGLWAEMNMPMAYYYRNLWGLEEDRPRTAVMNQQSESFFPICFAARSHKHAIKKRRKKQKTLKKISNMKKIYLNNSILQYWFK